MADTSGTYTLLGVVGFAVTREAAANQIVTYNLVGVADTFNLTADAGSVTTITQAVSVADVLNLSAAGGTISLGTGVGAVDTINATISAGGKYTASGTLANLVTNGSVTYGAGGGTYIVGTPGTLLSLSLGTAIRGFTSSADIIDNQSLQFSTITGYSVTGTPSGTQTITILDSTGNFSFTTSAANLVNGSYTSLTAGPIKLTSDGVGGTFVSVCFLSGTMIATPMGEVAVETLRPGDLVSVLENGALAARPVTWMGGRTISAADYGHRDEAFPVRIRAGAFARDVPHRDLFVTSEHCILTEAGLVPVRMLVNGASILIDRSIPDYRFFHVELESHGILLSEGLATESYLDTGNRVLFTGAGDTVTLRAGLTMAAPLAVARAQVEPIWTLLAERARSLGFAATEEIIALTSQPDLRLLLDNGRELDACWHNDQRHMFHIPRGARPLRLLSRAARPSEVVGPFVDDRRTLGVAVDRLVLWNGLDEQVMPADRIGLAGWHSSEGASRWTDGNAALDLPAGGSETFLDVHIAATMLYRAVPALAA